MTFMLVFFSSRFSCTDIIVAKNKTSLDKQLIYFKMGSIKQQQQNIN